MAWRDKNLYGADKTNDKCTFYAMGSDQSNLIISANKSKYMHALVNNRGREEGDITENEKKGLHSLFMRCVYWEL